MDYILEQAEKQTLYLFTRKKQAEINQNRLNRERQSAQKEGKVSKRRLSFSNKKDDNENSKFLENDCEKSNINEMDFDENETNVESDYLLQQPNKLKGGTLMIHQMEGLNWLIGLYNQDARYLLFYF